MLRSRCRHAVPGMPPSQCAADGFGVVARCVAVAVAVQAERAALLAAHRDEVQALHAQLLDAQAAAAQAEGDARQAAQRLQSTRELLAMSQVG